MVIMRSRWIRRVGRWLSAAFVILFALVAIGISAPRIPLIGFLSSVTFFSYGSWQVLFSLALAIIWFQRWRARGNRGAAILSVVAALSAVCLGWTAVKLVRTMRGQGVPIALKRSLIPPPDRGVVGTIETVAYGNAKAPLNMLVYPAVATNGQPRPILVYIHGGGWIGGTTGQRADDMRWFASRGLLVISIDYTLSTQTRHLWDRTEAEIGCGLAWVASHAARYGGDPGRVVLFGDSAGGNLAINAAYHAAVGRLASSCDGVPALPRAVIASYPVVDPASFYRNRDLLLGGVARMMAGRYVGGSPDAVPQRYAAVSSAAAITRAAPPTLLLVPDADHLVPAAPSFAFSQRARSAGVLMRLINVPGADHGFEAGPSGSIGNQLFRAAALSFLHDIHILRH